MTRISPCRQLQSALDDAKTDTEKAEASVKAERAEVGNIIHGMGSRAVQ